MTALNHIATRRQAPPLSSLALFAVMALLIAAALYHIALQPYPNQWDDSVYASATFQWLDFVKQARDLPRGIFWGIIYVLPHHMPPMVFVTSLFGGLLSNTLAAMRIAQLVWFAVLLAAAYGIGNELMGGWAGVTSAVMVGTVPLIFFWSKTIMGEPSMFAVIALLLFFLIRWGDKLNVWRSAIIGGVIGVGLLTKQHFPVSVVGPLGLWVIWLGLRAIGEKKLGTTLLLAIVGIVTIVVAGPWYLMSWQDVQRYASQPDFPLHTLGPVVSWYTVTKFLEIVLSQIGWPTALLIVAGLAWTCTQLIRLKNRLRSDWKATGFALLVVSGAGGFIAAILLRNLNTRFFVPALISWAALAGLALTHLWRQPGLLKRGMVIVSVALHLVFWWSQSFGPGLPQALTIAPQDPNLRPTNIELMKEAFRVAESHLPPNSQDTFWVVGNYHSFNQPTLANLATERSYKWQVRELYHWNETETRVPTLVDRIQRGELIAVYRQEREFKTEGDQIVSRFDDDIERWLQANPGSFELVLHRNSNPSNDEIWIYRRRG